jgi:hypothetical protein
MRWVRGVQMEDEEKKDWIDRFGLRLAIWMTVIGSMLIGYWVAFKLFN